MFPSVVNAVIGAEAVQPAFWMIFALLFGVVMANFSGHAHLLILFATLLLFSGLDVLGYWYRGTEFVLGAHLEWWMGVGNIQFTSMGADLLWVPQHFLPALMAVGLVMSGRRIGYSSLHFFGAIALPFWSPFVFFGALLCLFPLVVVTIARQFKSHFVKGWLDYAVALVAFVPIYLYLTLSSGQAGQIGINILTRDLLFFAAVEFVLPVLAVVLISRRFTGMEWLAVALGVATILVTLVLRFGLANDLPMRTTAIPFIVFAVLIANYLFDPRSGWIPGARVAALVILLVGAVTSYNEYYRLNVLDNSDETLRKHSYLEMTECCDNGVDARATDWFYQYHAEKNAVTGLLFGAVGAP